jgi:hypothetical protein
LCSGNLGESAPELFYAAADVPMEREVVDRMWRERVMAGMEKNTVRTYASAFKSFVNYFESMQWVDPYLGKSVAADVLRVVSWVNHLAVDRGLVYYTTTLTTHLEETRER